MTIPDTDASQSTWFARFAAAISIAVHVVAVAVSLGYAGTGLFDPAPEAVPVSLVVPKEAETPAPTQQLAASPEPAASSEPDLADIRSSLSTVTLPQAQYQPPQTPAAVAQQQSPATKQPTAAQKQQVAAAQPPPPAPAQPAYITPAPDISLRYQVDLGLKDLPATPSTFAERARAGTSDFDEAATNKADIDTSSIAAFRTRLRQCAALPAGIDPADKVVIVLRAKFTQDGRLAGAPTLIEASASSKGPALMQAAIGALQSCQPHNTLPDDKYAEWRVLDLRFTPKDFKRG